MPSGVGARNHHEPHATALASSFRSTALTMDWFDGRGPRCTLLAYIDDATSKLLELRFARSESTFDYFAATERYLRRDGKPVAFYSDKASIFRVNAREAIAGVGYTQLGRAMQSLNIDVICANTPAAKGRIERAHQTLQDRLVNELRLRGICDREAGNVYLDEFREDYNVVSLACRDTGAMRIASCSRRMTDAAYSPGKNNGDSPTTSPCTTSACCTSSTTRRQRIRPVANSSMYAKTKTAPFTSSTLAQGSRPALSRGHACKPGHSRREQGPQPHSSHHSASAAAARSRTPANEAHAPARPRQVRKAMGIQEALHAIPKRARKPQTYPPMQLSVTPPAHQDPLARVLLGPKETQPCLGLSCRPRQPAPRTKHQRPR